MNDPAQEPLRVHIDLDEDEPETVAEAVVEEDQPVALLKDDPDIVDEDLDPADRLPKHAIQNEDGSVTLPLRYHQTLRTRKNGKVKERAFAELTFHRLTGADLRAIANASDEMSAVVSFARSTRLNQSVMNALFDKMDASDTQAGGQVLNNFLTTGRKTGPRS